MNKRRSKLFVMCLLIMALVISPGTLVAEENQEQELFQQEMNKLNDIFNKLYENFSGSIDIEKFFKSAIDGALGTINDLNTGYYSPEDYVEFIESLDREFVGVGLFVEQRGESIIVVRPVPNSPAEEQGFQPGDQLVKVDGISIEGTALEEVVEKIRGIAGTKVVITIERDYDQLDITVERRQIEIPTVEGHLIGDIGYLRIDTFGERTYKHFNLAYERLLEEAGQDLTGLVLDVRDNSGGRLDTLIDIADIFLDRKMILRVIDKDKRLGFIHSEPGALDIPLTILVNHNSASAAELLAGALQDFGRATVIGTTTYGKGTVQEIISVAGGGHVRVTIANYLTPKGRVVENKGIEPDVIIQYPLAQYTAAVQQLNPNVPFVMTLRLDSPLVKAYELEAHMDAIPFKQDDIVYLPYRFIVEAMGGVIVWDYDEMRVNTDLHGTSIDLEKIDFIHPIANRDYRTFISTEDAYNLFGIEYKELEEELFELHYNSN